MALNPTFFDQVKLLVSALPQIHKEDCFALKGGTAINLFIRDMPRLSVDIDLAYIPLEDRDTSLNKIDAALKRIGKNITRYLPGTRVAENAMHGTSLCNRIQVCGTNVVIKIEVTPVLRGSIHPVVPRKLSPQVEEVFGAAEIRLLHFSDLYGGKICAALDRQHPRDLFDVKHLLSNEGITEELKNCFFVYLISHNRPMVELLDPSPKDIYDMYANEFVGMTRERITIEELYGARDLLLSRIYELLNDKDREFLLSVKSGAPKWSLFEYPDARNLPAVQWKLHNISHMQSKKRDLSFNKLEMILQHGPSRLGSVISNGK
jgi:predicted nucleotidyltransferase component of viral defense system